MNWEVSNFRHHPRDHRVLACDRDLAPYRQQDACGNSLSRDSETTLVAVNDFGSRCSCNIGSDVHVTRFE
jgi:hypothetical protein